MNKPNFGQFISQLQRVRWMQHTLHSSHTSQQARASGGGRGGPGGSNFNTGGAFAGGGGIILLALGAFAVNSSLFNGALIAANVSVC